MERGSGLGSGAGGPQGPGGGDAVEHDHGASLQDEVLRRVRVHDLGARGLVQAMVEDQRTRGRTGADRHAPGQGRTGLAARIGSKLPFIGFWAVMASVAALRQASGAFAARMSLGFGSRSTIRAAGCAPPSPARIAKISGAMASNFAASASVSHQSMVGRPIDGSNATAGASRF